MRPITFLLAWSICSLAAYGQENEQLAQLFKQLDAIEEKYAFENPINSGQHPETFPFERYENQIAKSAELEPILESLLKLKEQNPIVLKYQIFVCIHWTTMATCFHAEMELTLTTA